VASDRRRAFSWGGAINDVALGATACVPPRRLALLSLGAGWATDERSTSVRPLLDGLGEFLTAMRGHASTAS